MIVSNRHEHSHCSQTCRMGSYRSSCVAGHFLLCLSNNRLRLFFVEHNPNNISNSLSLALGWMENSKQSNKIATQLKSSQAMLDWDFMEKVS